MIAIQPGGLHRVLLLLLCAIGFYLASTFLLAWANTAPARRSIGQAPDLGGRVRKVVFESSDGTRLAGWLCVPASGRPRGAVVLCHGIRASRLAMVDTTRMLVQWGYAALTFDFRAHGESEGSRITLGWKETDDVLAACAYLRAQPEVRGCRLAVLGDSMGGAAALMAAARDSDIAAVVAQSPYSRLDRAVHNHFRGALGPLAPLYTAPARLWGELLIGQQPRRVSPEDAMAAIGDRPVLLVAGGRDRLCPPEEVLRLERAGQNAEVWIVDNAGHVEAGVMDPEGYRQRVRAFLGRHLAMQVRRNSTGMKP